MEEGTRIGEGEGEGGGGACTREMGDIARRIVREKKPAGRESLFVARGRRERLFGAGLRPFAKHEKEENIERQLRSHFRPRP